MEISERHKKIIEAEICPYCGSGVRKTTQKEIYNKVYNDRIIYCCNNYPECDAYVGSHKDGSPLGRLANKDLRNAKINAHFFFDKVWQKGFFTRSKMYKELSLFLDLPPKYTHIGMFNESTCVLVLEWSREIYFKCLNKSKS